MGILVGIISVSLAPFEQPFQTFYHPCSASGAKFMLLKNTIMTA